MSKFTHNSDEVEELGFINKEKILQYVSEGEIFKLVFGFIPVEFEYVTSPLRIDNNPRCWFETDLGNGKLQFRDFGHGNKPLDCFDVVQMYFNLPNFYETLKFIKNTLIDGKDIKHDITEHKKFTTRVKIKKSRVLILPKTRNFLEIDRRFWTPFEITKENLIQDKVFPTAKFKMLGTRKGDIEVITKKPTYTYAEFEEGRKKIYQPYSKYHKFTTNCTRNDIGGYRSLPSFGRQLIITKAYKDYRVLKNQGLNVVWFQNEGMFPDMKYLQDLSDRFKSIIVFFDNDDTGILASTKLVRILNTLKAGKSRRVCLDIDMLKYSITDPSDLIKKRGKQYLIKYLVFQKLL